MNHAAATLVADRMRSLSTVYTADVVRILPESIDPPDDSDNGWDVEVVVRCTEIEL